MFDLCVCLYFYFLQISLMSSLKKMTTESPDMLMHSICCNTVLTEVQEEDVVSWTCGCVLSFFSHVRPCAMLWTVACQVPLSNWDSPGMDTRVGCHALLQEIFPTQRSNPGLLRCQQILYRLSHEGSPGLLDTQLEKKAPRRALERS